MDFLPLLIFVLPIGLFVTSAAWTNFSTSTIAAEHRDRVREVRAQVLRERLNLQTQPRTAPNAFHLPSAPPASAPPLSPPPSSIPYPEGVTSPSPSSSSSSPSPRPAPTAPRVDNAAPRDCPICLDKASFAVETNCAHVYCAQCFLEYHERGGGGGGSLLLQPVVCPCCRRRVDAIMTRFTSTEESASDMAAILQRVQAYNARFSSQPRSFTESLSDTPTYLRRMGEELRHSPFGVVLMLVRTHFLLSLIGGVLYVVSPIDLLPELVMGVLGLVDDALVLLVICVVLASIYRTATVQRMAQRA